jgi:hypothetical protein
MARNEQNVPCRKRPNLQQKRSRGQLDYGDAGLLRDHEHDLGTAESESFHAKTDRGCYETRYAGPNWWREAGYRSIASERRFGTLGYFIVGLFVFSWVASIEFYKWRRFDELEQGT